MVRSSILSETDGCYMIHVWGPPAAGKTLFVSMLAAEIVDSGYVHWLALDGKVSQLAHLKKMIERRGRDASAISVSVAGNSAEARRLVMGSTRSLRDDTVLLVVDPITRVLDMSHRDEIMWGREMFEEALPTLAGLARARDIMVAMTSEIREYDTGYRAVYHDIIRGWVDCEFRLYRDMSSNVTRVYKTRHGGEGEYQVGKMILDDVVHLIRTDNRRTNDCSAHPF